MSFFHCWSGAVGAFLLLEDWCFRSLEVTLLGDDPVFGEATMRLCYLSAVEHSPSDVCTELAFGFVSPTEYCHA